MPAKSEPVSVKILDKEYLIACPADEREGLQQSARFLDQKMREIREGGKVVGLERIAVMAALNITHELLQGHSVRERHSQSVSSRIRALQEKIELALHQGRQMEL